MINKERLINRFMKYVTISSESFNEKTFYNYIVDELKSLNFEIIPDLTGQKIGSNSNNLIGRRLGERDGDYLGLCGHLDTVTPGKNIEPYIRNGIIYSGENTILGADDKAGIAIIIEIIQAAIENNTTLGPIELFFSIAEETGIMGSRYLETPLMAKDYYILDGTGYPGELVIGGPGTNVIDLQVTGQAAHAGLCPENGINAIEVISKAISQMTLGRISPITTANIGLISGGSAVNVVCPSVSIKAEVRSHCEDELENQTNHIMTTIQKACLESNATYAYQIDQVYSAFKIEKDNDLLQYSKKIIEDMHLNFSTLIGGGGSDANNLNQLDITPIIVGIGIENCHTCDESIAIDALETSGKMCYKLLENYWSQ